jgi:hypothetical protein
VDALTGQADGVVADGHAAAPQPDPVFVLCMARSGSTLLRFLLDAHPDLACPPETSLPALYGQLAVVWSLIEGASLSDERGAAPTRVPDAAVGGIRRMADEMTGSYLARRGKRLLCDKSLGSARFADLLAQIYPGTRFVCLYRHPMDMIRSGLDACPFGLNGYGFDEYIAGSPGNAVLALARYWLDHATLIARVEQAHPSRCHRVRYEDLVEDPESVMQDVYAFIGAEPSPGVARMCFSRGQERFGPADHKIWATKAVSRDSVGTGELVPAGMILPPVAAAINELAGKLGYVPVDAGWGTPGRPRDPRLPATIRSPAPAPGQPFRDQPSSGYGPLLETLRSRVASAGEQFASRWDPQAAGKLLVVCRTIADGSEAQWVVDIASRTVTADDEQADSEVEWSVVGSPETWRSVLDGQANLYSLLRRCDLRYCASGEDSPLAAQARVAMLADLLGLSPREPAGITLPDMAAAAAAATP